MRKGHKAALSRRASKKAADCASSDTCVLPRLADRNSEKRILAHSHTRNGT